MRAIPERLRGEFTTRDYTNPRLTLPLPLPPILISDEILKKIGLPLFMPQEFYHHPLIRILLAEIYVVCNKKNKIAYTVQSPNCDFKTY